MGLKDPRSAVRDIESTIDERPLVDSRQEKRRVVHQQESSDTSNVNKHTEMKQSIALSLIFLTSSTTTVVAADERRELQASLMCLANMANSGDSIESCCANAAASDDLCPALVCTDFASISIKDGCQCSSLGNLCANTQMMALLGAFVPGEG